MKRYDHYDSYNFMADTAEKCDDGKWVRYKDHARVIKEIKKHLSDANRGAEINFHVVRIQAEKIIELQDLLAAKNAEIERLEDRVKKWSCAATMNAETIGRYRVIARDALDCYELEDVPKHIQSSLRQIAGEGE